MARNKKIPKKMKPGSGIGEEAEFLRKEGGKTVSKGREFAQANREMFREEAQKAATKSVKGTPEITEKITQKVAKEVASRPVKKPPMQMSRLSQKAARKVARKTAAAHKALEMEENLPKLAKAAKKTESIGERIAGKLIRAQESSAIRAGEKLAEEGILKRAGIAVATGGARELWHYGGRKLGGKIAIKALGSTVGRIAGPAMMAYDVYQTGKAIHEGYKAYKAGKEAKELYKKMKTWKPGKTVSPYPSKKGGK